MLPLLITSSIIMLIVTSISTNEKSYADSPSFAKHEIIDYIGDWYLVDPTRQEVYHDARNISKSLKFLGEDLNDIKTVTFSSNSKILNITFWLTGPFNEKPVTNIPKYYVKIDADSNLLTGDRYGADYLFAIRWNNDSQRWEQIFQEYSRGKNIRIIESNRNYTNFFSEVDSRIISKDVKYNEYLNCCYISFPIDLRLMNYPETYKISFYILDQTYRFNGKGIEFLDSTGDLEIPIPNTALSSRTQKINLTENYKSAPIIVESGSSYSSQISLSIKNEKNFPSRYLSIMPQLQEVPAHSKGIFYLGFNSTINKTDTFVIPIEQKVYTQSVNRFDKLTYNYNTPTITESSVLLSLTYTPPPFGSWLDIFFLGCKSNCNSNRVRPFNLSHQEALPPTIIFETIQKKQLITQ